MTVSMMKEFKYDVKLLIQGVKERPCLWNKSLEVYKDRLERRNAWEEIFNILDERYEMMSPEAGRLTGEHILNKWTNIRDTFVKSLKTKMGRPKRKYVLYDQMKFLINDINGEEPDYVEEVNVPYLKEERQSEEEVVPITTSAPRKRSKRTDSFKDESCSSTTKKKSKKKEKAPEEIPQTKETDSNDIDFVEIDESTEQRLMNEDEAFFASLLPTVVKYTEDERLEFRIEVLGVMRRIKENRKWSMAEDS